MTSGEGPVSHLGISGQEVSGGLFLRTRMKVVVLVCTDGEKSCGECSDKVTDL